MASTSSVRSTGWQWPEDVLLSSGYPGKMNQSSMPGTFPEDPLPYCPPSSNAQEGKDSNQSKKSRPAKSWSSRTCRICLETILPTFHPPSDNLPDILQPSPSVSYISEDPTLGRLIRPCKCKGSSKYVHEGCLQAWRHADPSYGKRNYWQCPTCGFRYRLERMRWGRAISSTLTQISLTVSIVFLTIFLLGFVADPIINLYLDPYSTLSSASFSKIGTKIEPILIDDDQLSWTEHLIKGLASLGLLGFIKVLLALSPLQWWNLRSTGVFSGGGRTSGSGRDRLANISWLVVLIGVGTFLWVGKHSTSAIHGH